MVTLPQRNLFEIGSGSSPHCHLAPLALSLKAIDRHGICTAERIATLKGVNDRVQRDVGASDPLAVSLFSKGI